MRLRQVTAADRARAARVCQWVCEHVTHRRQAPRSVYLLIKKRLLPWHGYSAGVLDDWPDRQWQSGVSMHGRLYTGSPPEQPSNCGSGSKAFDKGTTHSVSGSAHSRWTQQQRIAIAGRFGCYSSLHAPMDTASAAHPDVRLKAVNTVGYVVLILVNVASQSGLLGDDNGTISDKFPTPLTPAGCETSSCMPAAVRSSYPPLDPEPSSLLRATYRRCSLREALARWSHWASWTITLQPPALKQPHRLADTSCVRVGSITCPGLGAAACRWAFSIWGIIFLLQGVGVVYQWLPQGYGNDGWKARIINSIGARACHT